MIVSVKQSETMLLTDREETIASELFKFSPALESWSDIYTGPTYHNTASTPDGVEKYTPHL